MNIEHHVGRIETCSECNQQKKIGIALDHGKDSKGKHHSPYLKCEDCVALQLKKDGTESRRIT